MYAEIRERRSAPDLAERTDVLSKLIVAGRGRRRPHDTRAARPAGHPAARRPRDHGDRAGVGALRGRPRPRAAAPAAGAPPTEGDDDYLEAVVKESMRLHPVIPMVVRTLMQPATIARLRPAEGHHGRAVDHHRPPARRQPRRPGRVPPRALPRPQPADEHLDPVRRRRPPLHRRRLRADGGRGGAARGVRGVRRRPRSATTSPRSATSPASRARAPGSASRADNAIRGSPDRAGTILPCDRPSQAPCAWTPRRCVRPATSACSSWRARSSTSARWSATSRSRSRSTRSPAPTSRSARSAWSSSRRSSSSGCTAARWPTTSTGASCWSAPASAQARLHRGARRQRLPRRPALWVIFVVSAALASLLGAAATLAARRCCRGPSPTTSSPAANALSSLGIQIGLLAGPAVGGLLAAYVGIGWCFLIDVGGLVVASYLYLLMRSYPHREQTTPPSLAGIKEGMVYAFRRRDLLGTYFVDIVAMMFALPGRALPGAGRRGLRPAAAARPALHRRGGRRDASRPR